MLRLLPSHESYRTVDGSIADSVELGEAERHLQYLVQGESFNTERRDLLDNKSVNRCSRIAQFTPFIGPHALFRSSGRLRRLVEIDFDTKHSTVLDARHSFVKLFLWHTHLMDARHNFVKLFLWHTHLKNHHQGIDYLRSKVKKHYAILKLRSTLRSIKSNCVLCIKFRAATIQPIMADLPKERLAYQSPPFTNTGVDYFGPFYVTGRQTTENWWGFLFTCLTTRAVQVEVVPSMDTRSCVMGVERFFSRRSTPAMLFWSDNGANFIGAQKQLRECVEKWNTLKLRIRALSGGSTHPVRHTKVASGRS